MTRVKWFDRKFEFNLPDEKLNNVLEKISKSPEIIKELVQNVPEEKLNRKLNGKWSIKENIGHLADLEELHSGRIDDFIEGKKVLRPADLKNTKTEQANHNSKSLNQIISEFESVREDFLKRIQSLDNEILERQSLHPRLNQQMRPVDMCYFIAEHDDNHIEIIKELIANQ
jgi:uncharacterized damage-inducible protein DinB